MFITSAIRHVLVPSFLIALAACDEPPPDELSLEDDRGMPGVITRALEEGSTGYTEQLAIRNGGNCDLDFSIAVATANGGAWLSAVPSSGSVAARSTSNEVTLGIDPRFLDAGLYTGSLAVVGTCRRTGRPAKGSPVTVAVNVHITAKNATLEPGKMYDAIDVGQGWSVRAPTSTTGAPAATVRHTATWIAGEMIVIGDVYGGDHTVAYDADLDEWRPLAPPFLRLTDHTAVAATFEGFPIVIMCGGTIFELGVLHSSSGCEAYDPEMDAWSILSSMPRERRNHTAVLANQANASKMLVFGGTNENGVLAQGLVFDLGTEAWASMTLSGSPSGRAGHSALWTGSEMLVLFGSDFDGTLANRNAAYDPATDTWRSIAHAPMADRAAAACAWTGREAVCFGGAGDDREVFGDGASYDPQRDVWTRLPIGPLTPRFAHSATWTGAEVVFAGGDDGSGPTADVAAWNPASRTWRVLPSLMSPSAAHTAVMTGNRMIFWGGYEALVENNHVVPTDLGTVYEADIVPVEPPPPGDGGDKPEDGPKAP